MFHKSVAQSVLLCGSESWVTTDAMRKALEGFHHRVARRISGLVAQRTGPNEWHYPPIEEALEQTGLWPMREYIYRRQNTIAQEIAVRPIYEMCLEATPATGSSRFLRWWQQDHSPVDDEEEAAAVAVD